MMTTTETHNLAEQCDWFSEGNRTEPRVTGRLDAASCLFLSIVPNEQAIPALICVSVLLTLFSLLINGLILFGLGWSEDLSWEPRSAFLKNLILSDLVQTVTFGPAVIRSLVQRRTMEFSAWCYIQYFAGTTSIFVSLVTITCMALERYLYVCHAIHYLVVLTQVRLRLSLSFIWVYSISIGIVNMVLLHTGAGQKNDQVTRGLLCEPDMVEQHMGYPRAAAVFRKLAGSCTLLLCLLVHAFSYLRMYRDACNAVVPFNADNVTARKTVLFYCGMLFLQLLPLLLKVASDALWEVGGTVAMMARSSQFQGVTKPAPSVTAVVLHVSLLVMLIVPPCINPLVYGLRNADTRRALRSLLRWLWDAGVRGVEWMRVRDVMHRNPAQEA